MPASPFRPTSERFAIPGARATAKSPIRRLLVGIIAPLLSIAWAACGSGEEPAPAPVDTGFAGTYATHVTLTSNSCGTVTVQDNSTIVTYDAASRAVTLSHAGISYQGTVNQDDSFTTPARDVNVGDGFLYSIGISGRFTQNAFSADATVNRSGNSTAACQFVVHWAATK